MATTIQSQHPNAPNPQLKRLVYSKYREMLGSYNTKANTIIQSLPDYMVKEDKGFHFDCFEDLNGTNGGNNSDYDNDDSVDCDETRYGAHPPAQVPPACVQNAMMTKDKKPFTYTPSGIDLAQIKSDRMAKRLARNAQMEGVSNQPKPSQHASQQQQPNTLPSPGLAQSSLGMPVQVFPTGPPPPPPPPQPSQQSKNGIGGAVSGGAPAPPPPPPLQASKNHLSPQTNGGPRKSPSPSTFEPPPMGFRPEIKIPSNPMATLKKVPKPKEKNDFWIEEYRKDRSKSPLVETESNTTGYQPAMQRRSPSPPAVYQQRAQSPIKSPNMNQYQRQASQQQQQPQFTPQSPLRSPAVNQVQSYEQNRGQSPLRSPVIQQTQQYDQNRGQSPIKSPIIAQFQAQQHQQSPSRSLPNTYQYQQQQQQQQQQQRNESPFQIAYENPNLQRPLSPIRVSQQIPIYTRPQTATNPIVEQKTHQYQPQQQQQQQQQPTSRNQAVGSLYIPPVAPENLATRQQQQQQQQSLKQQEEPQRRAAPPPNRWTCVQPTKDVPDWARQNDTTIKQNQVPSAQQTQQQQQQQAQQNSNQRINNLQHHHNPGLRIQMTNNVQTNTTGRERIIPIEMEKTPTPTRSPATPGFGPQPYQNVNQQFSSVASPNGTGFSARNPNQFVDQGYNDYPSMQQQRSPPIQQQQQQQTNNVGRVIPIKMEGQTADPFNANNVRGPINHTPMLIQNGHYNLIVHDIPLEAEIRYTKARLSDPRFVQHQNSRNGHQQNGPNQSKSFRILQKITDTENTDDLYQNNDSNESNKRFVRQMSAGSTKQQQQQQQQQQQNEQMRRMQISNNDQEFINQLRNHGTPSVVVMNRQQIHPRTRFIQQNSYNFNEDQQYVHPSQQQVPEPKIYTGSAIPSRSFKLLQASMTTPENAAEMEGSDVVDYEQIPNSLYNSYPPPYSPYPYNYPYPPPYPYAPPPIDPNNWPPYPSPYPPIPYYYYYPPQHHTEMPYNDPSYQFGYPRRRCMSQEKVCMREKPGRRDSWRNSAPPNIIVTQSFDETEEEEEEEEVIEDDEHHHHFNVNYISCYDDEINKNDEDKKYAGEDYKKVTNSSSSNQSNSPFSVSSNSASPNASIEKSESENFHEKISNSSDDDDDAGDQQTRNEVQQKLLKDEIDEDAIKQEQEDYETRKNNYRKAMNFFKNQSVDDCKEIEKEKPKIQVAATKQYLKLNDESSTDDDDDSDLEEVKYDVSDRKLQAIKSVTNIQVYNEEDDIDEDPTTMEDGSDVFDGDDTEVEDELQSEEDETEIEEEEIINCDLSVIYEESENFVADDNEFEKKSQIDRQNSESFSESSTTIENDGSDFDIDANDNETKRRNDDENTVTVRLPLRLTSSKSSQDENQKTNEMETNETTRTTIKSFSLASVVANSSHGFDQYDDDSEDEGTISVTISLPSSKNESQEKSEKLLMKTFSIDEVKEISDEENDDDDVSVSFSLSMRNKFMNETLNGDLTNNISSDVDHDKDDDDDGDMKLQIMKSNSLLISPSYKNIWQSFGTTLKGIATKEESVERSMSRETSVARLSSNCDEVEDFWASIKESRAKEETNEARKSLIILENEESLNEICEENQNEEEESETDVDFWAHLTEKSKDVKSVNEEVDNNDEDIKDENETEEINANNDDEDFWGSINKERKNDDDDNFEEKRKNYKNAMEFFRSKQESSEETTNYKPDEGIIRTEESKKKFQDICKNFGNSENVDLEDQIVAINEQDEDSDNEWELKSKVVKSELALTLDTNEPNDNNESDDECEVERIQTNSQQLKSNSYRANALRFQRAREEQEARGVRDSKILEDDDDDDEEDDEDEYEEIEENVEVTQFIADANENEKENHFVTNPTYNSQLIDDLSITTKSQQQDPQTDLLDKEISSETRNSVRNKIMSFETGNFEQNEDRLKTPNTNGIMSRTSSLQRSESELEEDDSGVTDMSKPISETDTESECFPELKKMTRYQRAATHSRLFKLLQDESEDTPNDDTKSNEDEKILAEEFNLRPSRKKIIHNVSITRRNNPDAIKDAESMSQRRERLSLPLKLSTSIDSDNLSTSNSPTNSTNSNSKKLNINITQELVNELVQSLLLKKNCSHLKSLPMEKLQAAAKRVLEEDLDSLENTSLESTPALTPQEFKNDSSYTDYYDTWNTTTTTTNNCNNDKIFDYELIPSKAFRNLQEQQQQPTYIKRKSWSPRCPRVLSSKTINHDLTRVSESPENFRCSSLIRTSTERDSDNSNSIGYSRAGSLTRRKL